MLSIYIHYINFDYKLFDKTDTRIMKI